MGPMSTEKLRMWLVVGRGEGGLDLPDHDEKASHAAKGEMGWLGQTERANLNARANLAGRIGSQGRPRNAKKKHTQAPMRHAPKPSNLWGSDSSDGGWKGDVPLPPGQRKVGFIFVGALCGSEGDVVACDGVVEAGEGVGGLGGWLGVLGVVGDATSPAELGEVVAEGLFGHGGRWCCYCGSSFLVTLVMDRLRAWLAAHGGSFHPSVVLTSQGIARFPPVDRL